MAEGVVIVQEKEFHEDRFRMENIDFQAIMIASRPAPSLGLRDRAARILALAAFACGLAAAAPPPGPYELGKADWRWVPVGLGVGIYGQMRYQGMDPVDTADLDRNRDLWYIDRWD